MPATPHKTITQTQPAYEPPHSGVRRRWLVLIAGLLLAALGSLLSRPVCRQDFAGEREYGFGVRHEQRGTVWYHCEPWIRRVMTD